MYVLGDKSIDIKRIYMMHEAAGGSTKLRSGSEHACWAETLQPLLTAFVRWQRQLQKNADRRGARVTRRKPTGVCQPDRQSNTTLHRNASEL